MRIVLAAALIAALAGCGGHGKATSTHPTSAAAPKQRLHVVIVGQSHHPRVGERWRYQVRVTDTSGKPVPANIHLQFLFAGVPVGQVGRHRVAHGVWSETFGVPGNPAFPARARGQSLQLQAIATSHGRTGSATYSILVR